MKPPTWRALAARADRVAVALRHGPHEAVIFRPSREIARFTSWLGGPRCKHDAIILRTAVAAALEQLEARR